MDGTDQRTALDRLVGDLASGRIDRRTFLRRGTALAISLPTLGAVMAATAQSVAAQSPSAAAAPVGSFDPSKPLIAFLGRNKQQVRWDFDAAGFEARAKELGVPYVIQFTTEGDDQSFQNTKAENLLAQGIKAIAVVPFDEKAVQPIIDAAHSVGAKYIAYGNDTVGADFILRRNNESVGATFATEAVKFAPKGNYVLVYGEQGNDVAEAKKRGIWSVIQPLVDSGDIKIVSEQYTKGWDPQLAQAQVEAALASTGGDIKAVIASNDGMGLGSYTALKAAGLDKDVFVSGEDGDLARVQLIASGLPQITTWEPYPVQGATAADVATALATGADPMATTQVTFPDGSTVPAIEFKTVALTKDNILDQLVKSGFYAYDDVYKLTPEDQRPPKP
ncbi:MAG: substrate-binding domain-containing protein [Chloroflexota bacterium]